MEPDLGGPLRSSTDRLNVDRWMECGETAARSRAIQRILSRLPPSPYLPLSLYQTAHQHFGCQHATDHAIQGSKVHRDGELVSCVK